MKTSAADTNNIPDSSQHFDVIISGGGLSGSLMALSLSGLRDHNQQPLKIAIIEANAVLTESSASFDNRVLALSHGSANYLNNICLLYTSDAADE